MLAGDGAAAVQVGLGDRPVTDAVRLDPPQRMPVVVDDEEPPGIRARRGLTEQDGGLGAQRQAGCALELQGAVAAVATHEVGDEVVGGVGEQVGRLRHLGQPPPDPQHRDLVAELDGLVDVVGDEDDRLAELALQAQELVLQLLAHHRVDRRERLVHEHHRRVGRERPGDADALLLSAGELRGVPVTELGGEADPLEQLPRALADPLLVPAEQAGHRADVLRGPCGGGRGRRAG